MDKTAIKAIQDSANIPELVNQIKAVGTRSPVVVVPEAFNIQSMERFMEHRSSYRGSLHTDNLDDFVTYSTEFDTDGAKCFVDAASMKATAIFDLGTKEEPGHQVNKAHLGLTKTAPYAGLLRVNEKRMTQKELAEWIEDWSEQIQAFDQDNSKMTAGAAASAIRKITIEQVRNLESEVQNFSEHMSAMERIEASSKEKMPGNLVFTCTPYNGLASRSFEVRLSILTGSEKPALVLRIRQLELIQEEMAEEFKELLNSKFEEAKIKTFIGRFDD